MEIDTEGVRRLGEGDYESVVSVMCDAFASYPVPRFVLGSEGVQDPARIQRLIGMFVTARVLRREPMLGIFRGRDLIAAALVSSTETPASPPEFVRIREAVWRDLGPGARSRYEAFGQATGGFSVDSPHLHLNMVGVRRSEQGQGLGRRLIDAVQSLSREDPKSEGVSLTTEDRRNVAFYEHLGFELIGHARVAPELETWGFFRPDRG